MNNNETKRNLKLDADQTSKQQIYKRNEKKWENVPIKWQKQQAKKSYENLIKINHSPRQHVKPNLEEARAVETGTFS